MICTSQLKILADFLNEHHLFDSFYLAFVEPPFIYGTIELAFIVTHTIELSLPLIEHTLWVTLIGLY